MIKLKYLIPDSGKTYFDFALTSEKCYITLYFNDGKIIGKKSLLNGWSENKVKKELENLLIESKANFQTLIDREEAIDFILKKIEEDEDEIMTDQEIEDVLNNDFNINEELLKGSYSKSKNEIRISNFDKILSTYEGIVEMNILTKLLEFNDLMALHEWLLNSDFKGYVIKDGKFTITSTTDLTQSIDDLVASFDEIKSKAKK